MRTRSIGALVLGLGLLVAHVGLAPTAPADTCACSVSEAKPWSGPPEEDPSLDTCDLDPAANACVRFWGVEDPAEPAVAVCVADVLPNRTACAWTTEQDDGEPGGFLGNGDPGKNDPTDIGVCVERSDMADEYHEPYACVNEYGDPQCEPHNCHPDGRPCVNGTHPSDPDCVHNTYDPSRCLVFTTGMDCVGWSDEDD